MHSPLSKFTSSVLDLDRRDIFWAWVAPDFLSAECWYVRGRPTFSNGPQRAARCRREVRVLKPPPSDGGPAANPGLPKTGRGGGGAWPAGNVHALDSWGLHPLLVALQACRPGRATLRFGQG